MGFLLKLLFTIPLLSICHVQPVHADILLRQMCFCRRHLFSHSASLLQVEYYNPVMNDTIYATHECTSGICVGVTKKRGSPLLLIFNLLRQKLSHLQQLSSIIKPAGLTWPASTDSATISVGSTRTNISSTTRRVLSAILTRAVS